MNQADFKSQIQSVLPIESYIGRYVALSKKGKYLKGLCPFHTEKTPSFTVTPEKGIYHCFGCGRGGDVITFVMEMEGISFNEALDVLSAYTGIKKSAPSGKDQKQNLLYDINARAMQIFSNYIKDSSAIKIQDYVRSRKINDSAVQTFHLGASPDSWQFLTDKMKESSKYLLELGLIRNGKSGQYDFFRNRLIFPIQDIAGHFVGFGGRALPGNDQEAKYINSPESAIFHKGSTLYGLFHSLSSVKQEKEIYIVEGYLDVIGLFQQGVTNVAAPLGTAFTEDHLKILQRHTETIVLVMDGDSAGKKAALRACQILLQAPSLKTCVVILPEGRDAFDLSTGENKETIRSVLANRIPSYRFLLYEILFPGRMDKMVKDQGFLNFTSEMKRIYDLSPSQSLNPDMQEKRSALERLFHFISDIKTPLEKEIFLNEGAVSLGLDPASVKQEMNKKNDGIQPLKTIGNKPVEFSEKIDDPNLKKLIRIERELITEIIFSSNILNYYIEEISEMIFFDENSEILYRYLEGQFSTGNLWVSDDFVRFEIPRDTVASFSGEIIRHNENIYPERDEKIIVRQLLDRHEELKIKKEIKELENRLLVADSVEQEDLLISYNHLVKDLKERENRNRKSGSDERKK